MLMPSPTGLDTYLGTRSTRQKPRRERTRSVPAENRTCIISQRAQNPARTHVTSWTFLSRGSFEAVPSVGT